MSGTIVFHHPLPVLSDGASGSRVRPYRMVEAFRQLGFQVELVAGYALERKKAIGEIKSRMLGGWTVDFVYSESSTSPTLLTEPHHLPTHPLLDFGFFSWLKRRLVPIGLYYRDIHWKFDQYTSRVPWYKQVVAIPMYRYDWRQYRRLVDHLFLPSLAMKGILPGEWPDDRVSALPPGCSAPSLSKRSIAQPFSEGLHLLYVGSVLPPLYDLQPTIEAVRGTDLSLTICCPAEQWETAQYHYRLSRQTNARIVHAHGTALEAHYAIADLFVLAWNPQPYLDFAMPVKVFEALGYGLPIVTLDGTEAARFVVKEGVGWVAAGTSELRQLLLRLQSHPRLLAEKREHVATVRTRHTWLVRAQAVANILSGSSGAKTALLRTRGTLPAPSGTEGLGDV